VADSCCSQSVLVLTVHSCLGIVGVISLITSQRFCGPLGEAPPLGESVLNDSTRPLPSIVMTKTILLVPDSRSLRVAASHTAWGGLALRTLLCDNSTDTERDNG